MIFTTTTLLAVLPLLALAAPTPQPIRHNIQVGPRSIPIQRRSQSLLRTDGTANIDFLRSHRAYAIGKVHKGAKSFERNKGVRLASARKALKRRQTTNTTAGTGVDPLTDDAGALWHGTITVGTPPVSYTVDFDTGSSDLFLPGPNCTVNCDGHQIYDPSNSSTSSALGTPFTLTYGDGSTVEGTQFTDAVTLAGLGASNQTLGAASKYSDGFSSTNFPPDGLMGMGFQSISEYNAPPVFQTLVSSNVTSQPIFSFKFAQNGSELFVGGTNDALHTGNFSFANVTEQGYWQVNMDSVNVNSGSASQPVVNSTSSIIDTGTTLIIGDSASVKQFYAAIPGSKDATQSVGDGFFTVPCDTVPSVSLTFGGQAFSISTATFNLGATAVGSSDCVGGIVSGDVADIGWIVGDVFLQNVYTSFDFGNSRVGFANLA